MYFLRHLTGALASPLSLAFLLTLAAATFQLIKRPRAFRWLLVSALLVIYLGSTSIVGNVLLLPLERGFEPLAEDRAQSVSYIVVLGSSYTPRAQLPVTATLDQDGLARIVEGIRLAKRFQTAKLVVSGGAPPGLEPPAHGYALLATDLGIAGERLVILDQALDTGAEARSIAQLLGHQHFVLVTSAYHMRRAVRQMQLAGTEPIPAPTGQLGYDFSFGDWRQWLPTSSGLRKSECALHEYLGLAALAAHLG